MAELKQFYHVLQAYDPNFMIMDYKLTQMEADKLFSSSDVKVLN